MRLIILCLLAINSINVFGQYINGPANIRDKPNGNKLFSVNDYVKILNNSGRSTNDWHEVKLVCYVKPDRLIDKTIIKQSTTIFSANGDSIGFTYSQFQIDENLNKQYRKYDELDKINISLKGYTHKSNIRLNISNQEIINNKIGYADSCVTRYITYQEENRMNITLIDKCDIYSASISNNDSYESVIIRERQKIKRISGGEGQESQIDIEIISDYYGKSPRIKNFSAKADKVEIRGKLIKTIQFGCCGSEDTYQLYNSNTLNKLMVYNTTLYYIRIPNSKIEGFIGYQPHDYYDNKEMIGTLTFSDGETIINKINFTTKDKNKFDNILKFVPDMEFIVINPKDKILSDKSGIELWSKNFSKSNKDLADFKFLVHLEDDSTGKKYTQELKFINGLINGNSKKEFDILID